MSEPNNDAATIHLLSNEQSKFFKIVVNEIKVEINEICESANLQGQWGLSEDFKFLVKLEKEV